MNPKSNRLGGGQLEHSISKAIDFLYRSQLPYGEFKTYASPDQEMGDQAYIDSSPFVTSIVLYSISSVSGPKVYSVNYKYQDLMAKIGNNVQLYQVISIDDGSLTYKSYTVTGALYDSFVLKKTEN